MKGKINWDFFINNIIFQIKTGLICNNFESTEFSSQVLKLTTKTGTHTPQKQNDKFNQLPVAFGEEITDTSKTFRLHIYHLNTILLIKCPKDQ